MYRYNLVSVSLKKYVIDLLLIYCNLKGKFREYLKYIGLKKYKDAGILLTQLLDAPQLIPTKYKEKMKNTNKKIFTNKAHFKRNMIVLMIYKRLISF